MNGTVKRLKANKVMAGTPCGWCLQGLALGDDAAACGSCGLAHHAACWDAKRGCSRKGCKDAPLRELKPPAAPPPPPPPSSVQRPAPVGSPKNAEGAVASLVFGILSLLVCGFVFGWFAYSKGQQAKQACDADPSLTGRGLAVAGQILGVVGIILTALVLVGRVTSH